MGSSSYEMLQDQKSSQRFRTVVKSLKDCEVFDTEEVGSDQEYDDDVIKEKEESSTTPRRQEPTSARDKMVEETDIGDLVSGVDIITDNITMDKAFEVFAKYEEEDIARPFQPPTIIEAEAGGSAAPEQTRMSKEIPALRIERMKRELDEL